VTEGEVVCPEVSHLLLVKRPRPAAWHRGVHSMLRANPVRAVVTKEEASLLEGWSSDRVALLKSLPLEPVGSLLGRLVCIAIDVAELEVAAHLVLVERLAGPETLRLALR